MIKMEALMNIRSLAKQGYSQRQIAKMTGHNRRTVEKYLQDDKLPVYRSVHRLSKLETYKPLIEGWLREQDYQASRIHELLLAEGFSGCYHTVLRYVQKVKEQRNRKAYIRFETMPGQQAQVDFADFQILSADGQKTTIYCFIMLLGYSRHMYIEFIEHCTLSNFLSCHQHGFGFFGGIPAEILYDNMKNVVVKRFLGCLQWNRIFAAFAAHYGFKPLAAPPYSPWVKGKVERPIHYVRERFWRGYRYTGIGEANRDILRWNMSIAGQRIHGTTHEHVMERFTRERSSLGQLPHHPYDISEKVYRRVYKDCQIAFDGNRYVLPHECVGKKLLLKVKDGIVRIFHDENMVAVYRIPRDKGNVLQHPHFYQRLKADQEQIRRKYHIPLGKGKATRGLLKHGLRFEVMRRPLSVYDTITQEVTHV